MEEHGVSRQLASSYVKSGWLERFGSGAYRKPHEEISWTGALYTLQNFSHLNVHVGGKTALEIQGYAHYLSKNPRQDVTLWKSPDLKLPAWFMNQRWGLELRVRSVNLFDSTIDFLSKKEVEGVEIGISIAEMAILEYLYDIPNAESFDEAGYLMEGLSSLRPSILQLLLESCQSIRVKRLFLYLAEIYPHSWFKRLDVSKINLGSGKREVIKGGKLDSKYLIVVPDLRREDR